MVVAATLWSIWLGRNDSIFNKAKTSNKILQTLIFHRVAKWGGVAKLVKFTHIPLWQINPVGTIHVHHYLDKSKYLQIRRDNFHVVCMVDAAWHVNSAGVLKGGVGGLIINKAGRSIYCFSGPSTAKSILEAEVESILHMLRILYAAKDMQQKVVICSDSTLAINSLHEGLEKTFPLLVPHFDVHSLLRSLVSLNYFPSDINEDADELAKKGVDRWSMFEWWASGASNFFSPIRP